MQRFTRKVEEKRRLSYQFHSTRNNSGFKGRVKTLLPKADFPRDSAARRAGRSRHISHLL